MSLSTTDAITGAINCLTEADLCLLDATDVDCSEEVRELRKINNSLAQKLAVATEQEMKKGEYFYD